MTDQDSSKKLGTADINRVMKLLPHRYPFLLVDKIIDMDRDESAVGIKAVSINEPFFQGHFPQFPIMPGVLIIEGLAQTAGALCVSNFDVTYKPQLVYFMGIDRAKFRKPVPIILGILAATLLNHAAAATLGFLVSQWLSGKVFQIVVGAAFIAMAGWALIPDKEDEGAASRSRGLGGGGPC